MKKLVLLLLLVPGLTLAGRNASGTYSLPAGNPVITGTTISSTWANSTLADVAAEMTNSLDRQGRGNMLAPFKLIDGVLAAPGLAFANETGSGLFRNGAGDIRFSVQGTYALQLTPGGITIPGALSVGVIDRAGTIDLGATSGTTVTVGRSGQTVLMPGTLDVTTIDRFGAINIGTGNGTVMTIGRTGQVTVVPAILDAAVIDRSGTIGIGIAAGTTLTVGRSGQTVVMPGTLDVPLVDRAGTIGVGTATGTTVTVGRTGQTVQLPGTVTVAQGAAITGTISATATTSVSFTAASGWGTTNGSNNFRVRKSAGVVYVNGTGTAGASAAWTNVLPLPAGSRPGGDITVVGVVNDASGPNTLVPAIIRIWAATGFVEVLYTLDPVAGNLNAFIAPFTIGVGDTVTFSASFPVD